MARYLQVSSDIADRIASGKLAAGDELLSVRQAARRYETTVATIGRAYRHLADAGVIDTADRRRCR
ncbi:MAG: GntR family transcriptional regulator, partial [Streptosporangiaceae bacterium]